MCFLVWMFRIMQYKSISYMQFTYNQYCKKKLTNEILQILQKQPFADVVQTMCCWSFCKIQWKRPVPESKKTTPVQVLSCEFGNVFKNPCFTGHFQTFASNHDTAAINCTLTEQCNISVYVWFTTGKARLDF